MTRKTKLDWEYQHNGAWAGEYHAHYRSLRIRAVHDETPENPFTDTDGNWPMVTLSSGSLTDYDDAKGGHARNPLVRFSDHQLVHWQVHIAKAMSTTVLDLTEYWDDPVSYCTEGSFLREVLNEAFDRYPNSSLFDLCEELYALIDIPCLVHESRGYCQGDWAKVLIVATPEAQKEVGWTSFTPEVATASLESQAKLYDAWAWGDVYGYVIEEDVGTRPIWDDYGELANHHLFGPGCLPDIDDEYEPTWEEIPDGSCWGFYGSDFAWSGLEESAMEIVNAHQRTTVFVPA